MTIPLKTTKKGAAPPFLGFSPGLVLCGNCFRLSKRATDAFLLSWRGSRNTLRLFRLPYVKYSTGANKAICTAYRAFGKPDWPAARRAFLTGCAIGEWRAESICFFRRVSAISRPQRLFFAYFFLTSQKKVCRRRHPAPSAHPNTPCRTGTKSSAILAQNHERG